MDLFPALPTYDDATSTALLAGRRSDALEALTANVQEGWWGSAFGQLGAVGREVQGERADPTPLTREEFQAQFARPGLTYDDRMTRGRAAAMAATADENAARRAIIQQRNGSLGEDVLGFGAQMLGSALSPETFIPIAGPAGAALKAAGAARAAERFLAPTVGAAIGRGAAEGIIGNALVAPAVYAGQARYGEDITFGRVVGDLAAGAVIGGTFGGISGLVGRYADRQQSARLLDAAQADIAAGRPIDVPPEAIARVVEDAAMRSAPAEMAGVRLADLPVGPGGAPVTRAEFAALMERERLSQPAALADLEARDVQEARAAPGAQPVMELLAAARRGEAAPTGEKSLTQFVVEQGGIRDERGDVRNMMGDGSRTRPGLLNDARGLPVDEMAEKARAAGYFQEFGGREQVDAADGFGLRPFLEALDEDLNKSRVRLGTTEDARGRELRDALGDLDNLLERNGASIKDPPDRILTVLRGLREDAPTRSLDDLLRDDASYSWYREALSARQHIDRLSAAPPVRVEPDVAPRADAAEPPDPAFAHIETMRAEGRLTAADEAVLRAGADQSEELSATAKGLTEAAECLLRNLS